MAADTEEDTRAAQRSIAELVDDLSEQTVKLVRQELQLARAELTEKGKHAGIGAGLFGGASMLGLFALGALTAAAILGLSHAVASWLAALIVAGALGLVAGAAALAGGAQLGRGVPPVPGQTLGTVKQDVDYARERAREGRAS
jgi:hypothetical protein